jgi:uncharacterized protein DUF4114
MNTFIQRAKKFGMVVGVLALSVIVSSAQVASTLSKPQPANGHGGVQLLAPTTQSAVVTENPPWRIGGRVYSTGTEDVIVKILPYEAAFKNGLYLMSPGPPRFIAFNSDVGTIVNLGKLPAGEIVFGMKTPQNNMFEAGTGSRNPDQLPHAAIKTYKSGVIKVAFEDLSGPKGSGSDRDFNDTVFQLSGGVSNNNAVGELLKVIKEQKGEVRDQAIAALKQINPKAAADAGVN